jgi:hypothetical protein
MIQQVITCDVCGTPKRQSNHWFVACEQSGELRIGGWRSLHLFSPETKHLCGETCVHKLISHYLMRLVDGGTPASADKAEAAETGNSEQADCAEPSFSAWKGSRVAGSSPRCSPYAARDAERPQQPNRCVGRRKS